MTNEEISKWLMNIKNDIGETQYQPLWHYVEALDMAIKTLERKRGKWIDTGSGQECSICKEIQYGYDSARNFCANCGADMRGGTE